MSDVRKINLTIAFDEDLPLQLMESRAGKIKQARADMVTLGNEAGLVMGRYFDEYMKDTGHKNTRRIVDVVMGQN